MSTTQDEPDLTDEVIGEYSAENGVRVDASNARTHLTPRPRAC